MGKDIRNIKILGLFPLLSIIGIIAGAIGGYAYFHYIGCASGSCAITSNPWLSVLWGAAIGYLLFDMFNKKPSKDHSAAGNNE